MSRVKTEAEAAELVEQAQGSRRRALFAMVLELVQPEVAARISERRGNSDDRDWVRARGATGRFW
jgi:ketopantoate hydroxymethyltransferase